MGSDYEWFIKADLSKHSGEWVAILNKKIIAHNQDGKTVWEETQAKYPGKKPLFAKVPSPEDFINHFHLPHFVVKKKL